VASASSSLAVTLVAVLGATGVLPISTGQSSATARTAGTAAVPAQGPGAAQATVTRAAPVGSARTRLPEAEESASVTLAGTDREQEATTDPTALPAGSGTGKRVVFDVGDQRVWLVEEGGRVRRTYLVSGSVTDNLEPGSYEVYSTSRHAVGIDDSGTMQFMVRFAHGKRAAIGFHDIPVDGGRPVQTRSQLGTPQSHGCIRQARPDARALWYFAIVGTKVVVTA
jgi:lipoprotein-anchoring transpeptidase ErfK/SrfK